MPDLIRGVTTGKGVRLAYLATGTEGFPVVFLHGAMGRGACWQHVMHALVPGYRGIALDQRGHGRSDKPSSGYDREHYVADLECAVADLGLTQFALVGHSTGGLNAWVYAARHPEQVRALVIEDQYALPKPDSVAGWRQWLSSWPLPFPTLAAVQEYFGSLRPSLADYFAEVFHETEDGWRPVFSAETIVQTIAGNECKDWSHELSQVRCPALVVNGGDTDYLCPDEAERMVKLLPQGRLASIAGAAHTVHVDQPAAYIHALREFLGEALAGWGAVPREREYSDLHLEALARAQYQRGDAGFCISPRSTALLMIDMQEEFVHESGGPYRIPAAAGRIPEMARLLAACRERGIPVIHTAFAATHHSLDRPKFGACMPNRAAGGFDDSHLFRAAKFVAELQPLDSEVVILKPSYGAFFDTPLETILKRLGVETVILAGISTDCCVGTTARQAYERGFGAVVVSDATATSLPEMHEAELKTLRRAFARVLSVNQLVRELGEPRTGFGKTRGNAAGN